MERDSAPTTATNTLAPVTRPRSTHSLVCHGLCVVWGVCWRATRETEKINARVTFARSQTRSVFRWGLPRIRLCLTPARALYPSPQMRQGTTLPARAAPACAPRAVPRAPHTGARPRRGDAGVVRVSGRGGNALANWVGSSGWRLCLKAVARARRPRPPSDHHGGPSVRGRWLPPPTRRTRHTLPTIGPHCESTCLQHLAQNNTHTRPQARKQNPTSFPTGHPAARRRRPQGAARPAVLPAEGEDRVLGEWSVWGE